MTAREELRNRIAAKLHAAECGCPDWHPGDEEDERFDDLADAVMGLWDIVIYSTDPRIVAYTHPDALGVDHG